MGPESDQRREAGAAGKTEPMMDRSRPGNLQIFNERARDIARCHDVMPALRLQPLSVRPGASIAGGLNARQTFPHQPFVDESAVFEEDVGRMA